MNGEELANPLNADERNAFKKELASLLNRYGWDNFCECPDHILADYAERCLLGFQAAMNDNIIWHATWRRIGEE